MAEKKPHPNEVTRRRIETFFPSPVPDKLLNSAMECRGGYILQEVRPHWREPGETTKSPYAKLIFNMSTDYVESLLAPGQRRLEPIGRVQGP